jgi:hypothetical protein
VSKQHHLVRAPTAKVKIITKHIPQRTQRSPNLLLSQLCLQLDQKIHSFSISGGGVKYMVFLPYIRKHTSELSSFNNPLGTTLIGASPENVMSCRSTCA